MKIAFLVKCSLLWALNLQRLMYQVEAIISRELSYPHDVVERQNYKPHYIRNYQELAQQVDKSEFNSEYYSEPPHPKNRKVHKIFRVKKKKPTDVQNNDKEENNAKKRAKGKKKKKRNRKKTVNTFLNDKTKNAEFGSGDLEGTLRKPVDIIVHIKMED